MLSVLWVVVGGFWGLKLVMDPIWKDYFACSADIATTHENCSAYLSQRLADADTYKWKGGRSHRTRAHSHRMATRLWAHWPCALDQAGLQSDLDPNLLALFFPRGLKFRVTHLRQIFPRPRLGLNDPA